MNGGHTKAKTPGDSGEPPGADLLLQPGVA